MAETIYRHFFFGDDVYASQCEVRSWEQLYCRKHGDAARYVLDGSEQDTLAQLAFLRHHSASASLFGGPSLLLLKRICTKDIPTVPERKHLTRMLELLAKIPEGTTVLWWEPLKFADTHPLTQVERSRVHLSELPAVSQVVRFAQHILSKHQQTLLPAAQTWLRQRYSLYVQVKAGTEDERGWWLHTVLEGASIRGGSEIGEHDLEIAMEGAGGVADPFPITGALADQRFADAYRSAMDFDRHAEPSVYFGLFGAVAWQISRKPRRMNSEQVRHAAWLLGQVEILSKTGDFSGKWLLLRFIRAMELSEDIVPPRTLWLATLPV